MSTDLLQAHTPDPALADRLVRLHAGEQHVAISPEVGGSLAAFSRRWRDAAGEHEAHWLRPASREGLAQRNPLAMASFPLVPFCNRIRQGLAQFEGREIRFPPNHPAEDSPHPLHGIGWQRPWRVVSAGPADAELALDVEAGPAWPWHFSSRQRFRLAPERLSVEISLRNEDAVAMPAGIGHHPYFPHEAGTRLTTATRAMWEADAEVMPTALVQSDAVRQLRDGALLAGLHTDNNFVGWSREARIDWPASAGQPARRLLLRAEVPLDHFVLYCQRGYDYFCAEPVSQCTDWLNLQDRFGPDVLGGTRLGPGETLTARFELAPAWG
ncbi:MAG TPA: aldose 1-epimerase [Ramlibacter sp.]|uniref:aldose 1-epimerase n=1 Tax=Ramlibacter sp. TaxID=1917967 RepID=UPI002D56E4DC|nr:aldose 1-epimerase [Ramlibacter sp.]HZY16837.1 aldose 1-epimerase [Ramlibacter sp.]